MHFWQLRSKIHTPESGARFRSPRVVDDLPGAIFVVRHEGEETFWIKLVDSCPTRSAITTSASGC